MATWSGVSLSSGINIFHGVSGKGESSKVVGARPMASLGGKAGALSYNSRQDAFEDRAQDIDRSLTEQDRELTRENYGLDFFEGLDYLERDGVFVEKGAGRMIDSSLWNEQGIIVDRDALARQATSEASAYMASVVSVRREDAGTLHLETKEDFQRLLRSTWSKNVEQWGVIKDPADIRWVASYHTDADRNIHAHVLTWSAKDELQVGQTLSPQGTRDGKRVIIERGFAEIATERNHRSDFLRDLSRAEAVRQLGREVPSKDLERLEAKAQKYGYGERVSAERDIPSGRIEHLEKLQDKLRGELQVGDGRLSKNYEARATATDIYRTLKKDSPSFQRIVKEYENCIDAKADIKALPKQSPERQRLLENAKKDLTERTCNAILRSHLPEDVRERMSQREEWRKLSPEEQAEVRNKVRERRRREEERRSYAQDRVSGSVRQQQSYVAQRYGTNVHTVSHMGERMAYVARGVERSGARTYEEAPRAVQRAAMTYAREAMGSTSGRQLVERLTDKEYSKNPQIDIKHTRQKIERECTSTFAHKVVVAAAKQEYNHANTRVERGQDKLDARTMSVAESMAGIFGAMAAAGSSGGGGGNYRTKRHTRNRGMDDREQER